MVAITTHIPQLARGLLAVAVCMLVTACGQSLADFSAATALLRYEEDLDVVDTDGGIFQVQLGGAPLEVDPSDCPELNEAVSITLDRSSPDFVQPGGAYCDPDDGLVFPEVICAGGCPVCKSPGAKFDGRLTLSTAHQLRFVEGDARIAIDFDTAGGMTPCEGVAAVHTVFRSQRGSELVGELVSCAAVR